MTSSARSSASDMHKENDEAYAYVDEAYIDEALDASGFGIFHLVTIPACGLAAMSQSLQTNLLSFLQPCAGAAWGVSTQTSALLASANFATSCLATPVFGLLADMRGRQWTTSLSVLIMAVAGVLSACAPSYGALVAAQAISGIGMGGAMVPFDLLAELSPPAVRGAVVNVSAWFWAMGTMLVIVSAFLALHGAATHPGIPAWRLLIVAVNMPVLLAASALPWLPESPYWLLSKGRRASARRVLARMARLNGVVLRGKRTPLFGPSALGATALGDLQRSLLPRPAGADADGALRPKEEGRQEGRQGAARLGAAPPRPPALALNGLVHELQGGGPSLAKPLGSPLRVPTAPEFGTGEAAHEAWMRGMRQLLSDPALRSQSLRHWAVWLFSGFGWTGLVFSATLSTHSPEPHGAHAGCSFDYWHQFLIMVMELPGTLLVGLIADHPRGPYGLGGGRRGVQVLCYGLCALFGFGAAALPWRAVRLLCAMGARVLVTAGNSAMWIAAPELYPTHVRGLGASVASLFSLLGAVPASAWTYTDMHPWLVAAGIAVANALAAAFAASLPETAGVALNQAGILRRASRERQPQSPSFSGAVTEFAL